MTFTITLLGTATSFTPNGAPDAGYPRGETLSVVSTMIAGAASEKQPSPIVQYASEHAQVIQGPDNLGCEVGNRITHAVLAILEKMAQGETQFNLMAHSRGAVEAILVAHELERIQSLFKEKSHVTLHDLANSPDIKLTQSAMKTLLPSFAEQLKKPEVFEKIKTGFKTFKLGIFNIDPVPGGRWQGVPTRWVDERFYQVPAIVNEYTECIYEHERSRSFKAIIPKHCENTTYELIALPGHHGTGSGNFIDQKLAEKTNYQLGEGKTSHVQELMIVKLLQFLDRNGVKAFDLSKIESLQLNADLGQVFRAVIDNEGCNLSKLEQKAVAVYAEIQKNKAAYEYFKNTTYVTGKEQSWKAAGDSVAYALTFGLVSRDTTRDDRFVHFHQHSSVGGDVFLGDVIDQSVNRQYYVNHDHAELSFRQVYTAFGMNEGNLSIVHKVERMMAGLLKSCQHIFMREFPDQTVATDSYRTLSPTHQLSLQSAKDGSDIYERCAEFFIGEMSQAYLSGRISLGERGELLERIQTLFAAFKAELDKPLNEFQGKGHALATNILQRLQQGLMLTLQQKNTALLREISSFEAHLFQRNSDVARNFLNQLEAISTHLNQSIASMPDADSAKSFMIQQRDFLLTNMNILDVQLSTGQVDLNPQGITEFIGDFIDAYNAKLDECTQGEDDTNLQAHKEKMIDFVSGALGSAHDAMNAVLNKKAKLAELVTLYQELDHYLSSIETLESSGIFTFENKENIRTLMHKKEYLLNAMGQYIYENQLDVNLPDLWVDHFGVSSVLRDAVQRRVKAMEAGDPRIASHQRNFEQDIQEKQAEIETLESEMKTLASALSDEVKKIESIDQLILEKSAEFEKTMKTKQAQIENLEFEHQTQMLTLDIQTRADFLEKTGRERAEIIEYFESNLAQKQQIIDYLSTHSDVLRSTMEFNDALLVEKEEKIRSLEKIMNQSIHDMNGLLRANQGYSEALGHLQSQNEDILAHNFRVRNAFDEALGHVSKLQTELTQFKAKAALEINQLKTNNAGLQSIIAAQRHRLIALETKIIRLENSLDHLTRAGLEKDSQIERLTTDVENSTVLNAQQRDEMSVALQSKERALSEKSVAFDGLQTRFDEINVQLVTALAQVAETEKLVQASQAENSALRQAAAEATSTVESERRAEVERLKRLIQTKEAEKIDELRTQSAAHDAEKKGFEQTNLMFQRALVEAHAANESVCKALVNNHLMPLTTDYLRHLLKEQHKTVAGSLQREAVDEKIEIIEELQRHLDQVNAPEVLDHPDRNQQCVRNYYGMLDRVHETLSTHRDSTWMRYVANTVKVLSIVLTGILPGLAVLGIVSAFTGKSNQFWVSHGATFFGRAQESKPSDHWVEPRPAAAAN